MTVTFCSRFWPARHLSCWKVWGMHAWSTSCTLFYFAFFFSFLKEYWKKDSCHKILDVSLIYLLCFPSMKYWQSILFSDSRYILSLFQQCKFCEKCISATPLHQCFGWSTLYQGSHSLRWVQVLILTPGILLVHLNFFFAFSQFGNLHLLFASLVGQTKMLFLLLHGMGGIWHFLKGWLQADYGTFKAIPVQ